MGPSVPIFSSVVNQVLIKGTTPGLFLHFFVFSEQHFTEKTVDFSRFETCIVRGDHYHGCLLGELENVLGLFIFYFLN